MTFRNCEDIILEEVWAEKAMSISNYMSRKVPLDQIRSEKQNPCRFLKTLGYPNQGKRREPDIHTHQATKMIESKGVRSSLIHMGERK